VLLDGICIIYIDCIDPLPSFEISCVFVSTCLFTKQFVCRTGFVCCIVGMHMISGDPSFLSGPVFCGYCLKFLKICFSFPGNKVVKKEGCKTGIAINLGLVVNFCNNVFSVTETQHITSWNINFSVIISMRFS